MALLDRFRTVRPPWEDPDPTARAEAVRSLRADDAALIASIFRNDGDPLVRRAALRKLDDVPLIVEAARSDGDQGIREEAAVMLMRLATEGGAEQTAAQAAASVVEARSLATLARTARHASVREAALARLADERLLANVAKTADDARIRMQALLRVSDAALRAEIAQKSEHKDVAAAALEGVLDRAALAAVAEHARARPAARRARAALDALDAAARAAVPAPAPAPPPDPDESPEERAEREAREHAVSAREALLARSGELLPEAPASVLEELRAAWERLPPLAGTEADALRARFERDLTGVHERRERTERAAAAEVRAEEEKQRREREAQEKAEREQAERKARATLAQIVERAQALAKADGPALRDVEHAMRDIRTALEDTSPALQKRDREALVEKLRTARAALYPRLQELRDADEWKRWANTQVQQELITQMEALAQAPDLDKAAPELRDLNERWRQFSQARKEEAEPLWLRFRTAREALQARLDEHQKQRAEQEAANLARMLALCEQAEALAGSTDWLKTADKVKALQVEWKTTGPAQHREQRKAWERFHAACNRFFTARKEDLDKRKQDWTRNLDAKEALIQKAEALAQSSEWEAAAAEIKKLQGEWKAVGPVKKSKSELVWQRFRAACDAFFERYKRRDDIAQQQNAAERAALLEELEALVPGAAESAPADAESAPADAEGAPADAETAPADAESAPADAETAPADAEGAPADAEGAPADAESPAPEGIAARVLEIGARWRQSPLPSGPEGTALHGRFTSARDRLVEAWPAAFLGTDLDPEANRARREKLVLRVEAVANAQAPAVAESSVSLAERLREALATNSMGGRAVAEARWREAQSEIEQAEAAWKRLGPVPGDAGRELAARFEKACQAVQARRPRH